MKKILYILGIVVLSAVIFLGGIIFQKKIIDGKKLVTFCYDDDKDLGHYCFNYPYSWKPVAYYGSGSITFNDQEAEYPRFSIRSGEAFSFEGMEEVKKEELVNSGGIKFYLSYFKQTQSSWESLKNETKDESIPFNEKDYAVVVSSPSIEKAFFYYFNEERNKDAVRTLKNILESIK